MKVAAVQMTARLGEVEANMEAAGHLAKEAFGQGAEMVILPEFFTTAMGYSKKMRGTARPTDGGPFRLLMDLSKKHGGAVGGSFIAIDGGQRFNRFILAFEDGSYYVHDKDQPTMWENCYYVGGTDKGVLETPRGRIGTALCWEFVRTRTARRLLGKVDLVVGGSCWWNLPRVRLPGFGQELGKHTRRLMIETPGRFARLVGAPVVHAAHAGNFSGRMPLIPGFPYESYLEGETQITDSQGNILKRIRREEGAGVILADIDLSEKKSPEEKIPQGFWIPKLPWRIRFIWAYQNLHGKWVYRLRKPSIP